MVDVDLLPNLLLSSPSTNHHNNIISFILHLTFVDFTKGLILQWLHRYLTTSSLPWKAKTINTLAPPFKQNKKITLILQSHIIHSLHISSSTHQILHNLHMTIQSSFENGCYVGLSIQSHIILTIYQTIPRYSIPAPSSSTNLFTSFKSPLLQANHT